MTISENQVIVQVKVIAGASRDNVKVIKEGKLEISVREKPKENAANSRVLELVAEHFKVPVKAVRLISGHHRPSKKVSIHR